MRSVIFRTKILFLILFAVGATASWGYQIIWVWPAKRCEEHRGWWDVEHRICATPVDISMFTRRAHPKKPIPELPNNGSAPATAPAPAKP